MSLLPYLFDEADLWRPSSRMMHRNRGFLDELMQPVNVIPRELYHVPELFKNLNAALQDTGATVTVDKDKFQANFDVQHFKPEEISVKVTGDKSITIEGKHEEKQDEHGQIYRHFVRKYTLPENCDMRRLESKLSTDGVLSLTAPRVGEAIENRSVPIVQTGQPAKSLENSSATASAAAPIDVKKKGKM